MSQNSVRQANHVVVNSEPPRSQALMVCVCVCMCVCVRACVRACVRVRVCVCFSFYYSLKINKNNITPILRQLHWFPIQKRICHKIISATYRSVHYNTPLYLSDLLQKHNPSRLLISASRSLLMFPGPGIPRQSSTASEPSDRLLPLSRMSSPRESRRKIPFSLSDIC